MAKVLGVSRNTVAEIALLFNQSDKSWDDICDWDDDRLYELFYPNKFKYKPRYAPVDYSYVHKELKKTGVTEKLLWEEYCEKCEKVKVVACSYITFTKNYKKYIADKNYTSHIEHKPGLVIEVDWSGPTMNYVEPDTGEIITAYLTLGEYYSVAIMPTGVRKPKQKASVEGSVGKIATAIIAKLRNEIFTSLGALNAGIRRALKEFNDKPFQKREGSRSIIFETEEKPYLRELPLVPFEVCEWSYKHKVNSNSHIWWNKGQYSVPSRYIGYKVDVKFNNNLVYIYYNRTEIAKHQRLSQNVINGIRTDEKHLPFSYKEIFLLKNFATEQEI